MGKAKVSVYMVDSRPTSPTFSLHKEKILGAQIQPKVLKPIDCFSKKQQMCSSGNKRTFLGLKMEDSLMSIEHFM